MRLSLIHEPAPIPGRPNEDTCGVYSDGTRVSLFVADGASQRLTTTQTAALYDRFGDHTTGGRFAAMMMHEVFEGFHHNDLPADRLIEANKGIAAVLSGVYGDLSAEAFLHLEPQLAPYLDDDPRLFRLALPVCVVTAVEIDLSQHQLTYAHAGDTALFLFHRDGRVTSPTGDQMGNHDAEALGLARQIQIEQGAAHLADVLDDPRVIDRNKRNGLYHNYIDEHGQTDRRVGVGVLNGLPQLEAYIQQGVLDLSDVSGLLVCSDGFPWPAPLEESDDEKAARFRLMRDIIERDGLRGYFEALRATEQADSTRDRYPRFKIHDDSTGIYVEF